MSQKSKLYLENVYWIWMMKLWINWKIHLLLTFTNNAIHQAINTSWLFVQISNLKAIIVVSWWTALLILLWWKHLKNEQIKKRIPHWDKHKRESSGWQWLLLATALDEQLDNPQKKILNTLAKLRLPREFFRGWLSIWKSFSCLQLNRAFDKKGEEDTKQRKELDAPLSQTHPGLCVGSVSFAYLENLPLRPLQLKNLV